MKKLYVGNIPWKATEEDLKKLFSEFGDVDNVRIITDRETGRSRGFGFVEMNDAEEAMNNLNDSEFMGRTLRVNEARDRKGR